MIGMEIVNPTTKEPDTKVIGNLMERTKELGLLMGKGGLYGHVIRFAPPLCITREDAKFCVEVFD